MKEADPSLNPREAADDGVSLALELKAEPCPDKRPFPVYCWFITRNADNARMGHFAFILGDVLPHLSHFYCYVFPEFRGRQVAARACRLAIPIATHFGISPIRITCREDNAPARRTAELVGAEFVGMVDCPAGYIDSDKPTSVVCKYELRAK